MYTLDKRHVELIVSDVERARITLSHLADELVDHICCEVENLMWEGKTFEEAYEIVKQQTGIKVLKKIQENTHYLIDKNYRIMKMTMKIAGNISLILLALGTVFRLFQWPGASIMLVLGFATLCLVFFPSAIYTNYRDSKVNLPKMLHISILIGGVLFMLGVLFKVQFWPGSGVLLGLGWIFILFVFLPMLLFVKMRQSITSREKRIIAVGIVGLIIFELSTMFKLFHWPGAGILMVVGSVLIVSVFVPLFTYSKFKETGKITGHFIFIITGTIFFILFSTLLAINTSSDFLGVNQRSYQKNTEIVNYLKGKNQVIYSNLSQQDDSIQTESERIIKAIHYQATIICNQIEKIKLAVIMDADDVDMPTAKSLANNVSMIKNQTNSKSVRVNLLGDNNLGSAHILKQELMNFQNLIENTSVLNSKTVRGINMLLATPTIEIKGEQTPWETYSFDNINLTNCLVVLSDIDKKVRMAERLAINNIVYLKQ